MGLNHLNLGEINYPYNMKTGPKYKIARRLGAPVFEKTQTAKYALSEAKKQRVGKRPPKQKSEFGKALNEKQKARFTYGLSEKQFKSYVDKAIGAENASGKLFTILESRLDNVLYRSGLLKTRAQARQASSHGHILVNGKRVTIPSIILKKGDKVSLRIGSADSPLFGESSERMKNLSAPAWILVDPEKRQAEVVGDPIYDAHSHVFDLGIVIEFYNR